MTDHEILLFGGGTYHDFAGFAQAMGPVLAQDGYTLTLTYDLDELSRLNQRQPAQVMLYTCLGGVDPKQPQSREISAEQTEGLVAWVRAGGRLLAAHSATVMPEWNGALRRLIGARFVSHPPQFDFTVTPLYREHPITAGVGAFTVHDEFYIEAYEPDVQVHMSALDRGVSYPMVWSRIEGAGKVAHVAPGHGPATWGHPAYRQLMRQTVSWLAG